jgi:hypothetical protein
MEADRADCMGGRERRKCIQEIGIDTYRTPLSRSGPSLRAANISQVLSHSNGCSHITIPTI